MPDETGRKRASRHMRLKDPPSMRLMERDKAVIRSVNDYRMMRQDQLQRLHFPSKARAQTRLWNLWQHQYLKRSFLPVLGGIQNSTILYQVDRRGAELLRREFGYSDDELRYSRKDGLSYRFLEHTLGLSELRLAAELSCRRHGFELIRWHDETAIKQDYDTVQTGARRQSPVLPDGYFVVATDPSTTFHFFLEYDRGSEPLGFFRRKIRLYWLYFQSPKPSLRYGTNRIRVLTVTESQVPVTARGRTKGVRDATKDLGAHSWFWFTSLDEIAGNDFLTSPIWAQTQTTELRPLLDGSRQRPEHR